MEIKDIHSDEFKKYGCVIDDDFSDILNRLKKIEKPTTEVTYVASLPLLEESSEKEKLEKDYFGFYPIQVGYCAGFNKVVDALEYHKSNEINIANEDFILVVGLRQDIVHNTYDLSKAEAFFVPKGTPIEVYSTSLHYCPISVGKESFNMLVVLPKGTNVGSPRSKRCPLLFSTNKWLIAYKGTNEEKEGAVAGLIGKQIVID